MSLLDLKNKYGGKNLKAHDAFNRAIRGEIVGGDDLLDALESVDRLTVRLRDRGLAGVDEAQAALDRLRTLRNMMETELRKRYDCAKWEAD